MALLEACHQLAGTLVKAGWSSKPGGSDGVIWPQMPPKIPIATLPRMLTRKAKNRASLPEAHRISPTCPVSGSVGRFDRKLAGVGVAEFAGISFSWLNRNDTEHRAPV